MYTFKLVRFWRTLYILRRFGQPKIIFLGISFQFSFHAVSYTVRWLYHTEDYPFSVPSVSYRNFTIDVRKFQERPGDIMGSIHQKVPVDSEGGVTDTQD